MLLRDLLPRRPNIASPAASARNPRRPRHLLCRPKRSSSDSRRRKKSFLPPGSDGRPAIKVIEKPQSTLQHAFLAPEDLEALDHIPAYPLTTSQLPKYNLKYIGKEQVDEIDCYIFQVKPKMLERTRGLFHGVIWVDAKYLEVVKTYGKWVTERGDAPILPQYPFALFETYRENVEGKYWFPNYSRSEDTLHLKDQNVNIRLVIKWSDFKPLPSVAPTAGTAPAAPIK